MTSRLSPVECVPHIQRPRLVKFTKIRTLDAELMIVIRFAA